MILFIYHQNKLLFQNYNIINNFRIKLELYEILLFQIQLYLIIHILSY